MTKNGATIIARDKRIPTTYINKRFFLEDSAELRDLPFYQGNTKEMRMIQAHLLGMATLSAEVRNIFPAIIDKAARGLQRCH